jgi:hypothetical protein
MTTVRERAAPLLGTMIDSEVADHLARAGYYVEVTTISAWRRDAGIPAHGRRQVGVSPEDVARAVRAYERCEGVLSRAALQLGWCVKTMRRALRQAGLR